MIRQKVTWYITGTYTFFLTLCCHLAAFANGEELNVDVCVYGGTSGGVVAAVQASRMGKSVALVEPGAHLGGLTSGGLSAVDIGEPRSVGGIAREYFTRLVARYDKELNWGEGFDYGKRGGPATGGAYSIEPHIAEDVFDVMTKEAGVTVWRKAQLASAEKRDARITALRCADGRVVRAKVFLDATYEGDLMAAAGVTYTLMREGNAKYGEKLNGIHYSPRFMPRKSFEQPGGNGRLASGHGVWDRDFPLDPYLKKGDPSSGLLPLLMEGGPGVPGESAPGLQAYCFRLCLSSDPENFIPISPPPDYDPQRYELVGRFVEACLANGDDMDLRWFSKHDPLPNEKWDFNTATFGGNLPGLSWDWPEASYGERKALAKKLENYHRGLFQFLRTDPRVPQTVKNDLAGFGLPKDEFVDNGGWPHQVYIREGRRMVSDLVMTEHHTFGRETVKHSVGLGSYGTDAHVIRRIVKDGVVTREGKIATGRGGFGPYRIGYGAVVPKRIECENLLVTFALSASHSAFASIRMEPPFMVTSQSAATAAVHAIDENVPVQDIVHGRLKGRLLADGQVLEWDHEKNKPAAAARTTIAIPTVDISTEAGRQSVVAQGTGKVYQGHPTTVLMPDGKTIYCVWTINHGGPCGPMKRSDDGGRTWSELLPVPENWREVRNCPCIYRLPTPDGRERLFVFAATGPNGEMHQSHSEDGGKTWTPMTSNGLVAVMPFCSIAPIDGGKRLLGLTNIRRPGDPDKRSNILAQSVSEDGGFTWSPWEIVLDIPGCKPCEPELVRSPDGKQILCLIRENNRTYNAWMMTSDNEGRTWSAARQLPAALTGHRHKAVYAPDGRLVVVFRDVAEKSPSRNHFVAWVGTYNDIVSGREGQYRAKLLHSHAGGDCGYPGLECLPDGTLVATTYIKYRPGNEKHSVVSTRFTLAETDAMLPYAHGARTVPVIRAGESQIFVDDVRVASKTGVVRKVHPAAKLDKPVLEAEAPWELSKEYDGGRDRRIYIYGTVLRDQESESFRMWYNRAYTNFYATSSDGISWQRPSLGLVAVRQSKDNNRLSLPFHSISVIYDEKDPDPAKRYKAMGAVSPITKTQRQTIEARFSYRSPYPDRAYSAAYSPDGLQWTLCPNNPALPGTDTITLAQDPATGEYLAFHKRHSDPATRPVARQVYLSTSKDFITWSKPELVMITDETDHKEARKLKGGTHAEFYNMSAFPYAGQWLGMVTLFRRTGRPPVKGPGQSPHDGPIDVQLVHSRDGRKWERCEDRSPVIALGPHAYDSGSILGLCNAPVIVGDEVWMYYTAMTTTHGGFLPEKQMSIARAAWRLDGMVSLRAGDSEGVIETVPLRPGGESLIVNADVRSGRLLVEVLDAAGRVVPGYEKSACLPLKGGEVRQEVAWRTKSSLPGGETLRLRFHLTKGDLYSYTFTGNPSVARERMTLDGATKAKALAVLREGLRAKGEDRFWVSIHAAEGLTLAGYGEEVRAFLEPMLATESDAQRRCGIARELVRAGDDSKVAVLAEILASPDPHGHKHAAESLYKVDQIGDREAMQRHFGDSGDLKLRLMAAAALARQGDPQAINYIHETLRGDVPDGIRIAAWILGRIGNAEDIVLMREQIADVSDPLVVAYLEHSLAALGDAEGMTALSRNLESQEPAIRTYAATFAGDAGAISVRRKLETMLDDPYLDAKVRAAQTLLQLSR